MFNFVTYIKLIPIASCAVTINFMVYIFPYGLSYCESNNTMS